MCERLNRGDPCPLVALAGNVHFERSSGVSFSNCSFKHLGAAGIYLDAGCQNSTITRCSFSDISGAAVTIGAFTDYNQTVPALQTANNTVSDCTISAMPVEFHGSAALTAFITRGTKFAHNVITDTPCAIHNAGQACPTHCTYEGGWERDNKKT